MLETLIILIQIKKILQKIESYTKTYYFKQLENTRTFHKYLQRTRICILRKYLKNKRIF